MPVCSVHSRNRSRLETVLSLAGSLSTQEPCHSRCRSPQGSLEQQTSHICLHTQVSSTPRARMKFGLSFLALIQWIIPTLPETPSAFAPQIPSLSHAARAKPNADAKWPTHAMAFIAAGITAAKVICASKTSESSLELSWRGRVAST